MTDDKVFIAKNRVGSPLKVYHTDEDCHLLAKTTGYRPIDRSLLYDHVEECSACSGTRADADFGHGGGHLQSLQAAAAERANGGGGRV